MVTAEPFEMEVFLNSRFPSTKANAIQAVRVAEAFARAGVPTTFSYRAGAMATLDWAATYGVAPTFRPRRYPGVHVAGRRLPVVNDVVTRAAFAARLGRGASRVVRVLYGWSPGSFPLRFFLAVRRRLPAGGPLVACEAHEGKDWIGAPIDDADAIVAVSGAVRRDLLAAGIPEEKIIVEHDGVDVARYERSRTVARTVLRRRLGLPMEPPLAVFTGHLYAERGGETLVEAIARIPDILLVFVGGRPDDIERVRRKAVEAGLSPRVLFTGERRPSEVPEYQASADVLLIPYGSDLGTRDWCSPMKLFEYMAAGVPIVASDFPVFHEVAEADREIVYVRPDDPEALAAGIRRVLGEPEASAAMARRALDTVQRYAWDRRAERILRFLAARAAARRG